MLDELPQWLRKSLGGYLRQCVKWADSKELERILFFYFGVSPPEGQAEQYAKAIAQRLAPLGRPRKDSRRWEQMELPWVNLGER